MKLQADGVKETSTAEHGAYKSRAKPDLNSSNRVPNVPRT